MNELDELEAQVRRQAQRRKLGLGLMGLTALLLIILPCVYIGSSVGSGVMEAQERRQARDVEYGHRMTPEQAQAIDAALSRASQNLEGHSAAWHRVLTEDVARVAEGTAAEGAGPCPHRLPLRPPNSAARHGSFNNLDDFEVFAMPGRQVFPWAITDAAIGTLPRDAPRVAAAREAIQRLRNLEGGEDSVERHAGSVRSAESLVSSYWTYDVLIVAESYQRPSASALGDSFTPGSLRGRALLYDYALERVVCAANVSAQTTSTQVDYTTQQFGGGSSTLYQMLSAEMDAEIERSVARAFRDGGALPTP